MTDDAIKSMKLYQGVERIYNDLADIGIGADDPLTVDDLTPFDQFHYFGTDAVDAAIAALGIDGASRVLDVGAGLGGPARYMAQRTGCHVTALELQADIDGIARSLTGRCGLADRVTHLCGDVLAAKLAANAHDALVSWLAFYHIADHRALFAKAIATLKPGGRLYVEDLFRHGDFDAGEQRAVTEKIYGQTLHLRDAYVGVLRDAGFVDVGFEDMTERWRGFTLDRRDAYHTNRAAHTAIHGAATVAALTDFYDTVVMLFDGGKLGGATLTARKPSAK